MRLFLFLLLLTLAALGGCNTMPEEEPGYHVNAATPGPEAASGGIRQAHAALSLPKGGARTL